ncbi:MAG: metallophosphoesterase family protein [Chloroflexota bacterium]
MRVLAVADAKHPALYGHFDRERWRGVELLIGCGDLPGDYLDFIATSLGVPFLYVRGNHDANLFGGTAAVGENVDGRVVTFKGLNIVGFEGSAWYGGKGIEYGQTDMALRVWSLFPRLLMSRRVDIVVTHNMPAMDAPRARGIAPGPQGAFNIAGPHFELVEAPEWPIDHAHRGFTAFTSLLNLFQPRLWLHGHTHLSYSRAPRVIRYHHTLVANAFEYFLFDIDVPARARAARLSSR